MAAMGLLANMMAVGREGLFAAIVAVIVSDETDGTAKMHEIVSGDELIDPSLRFFQALEGFGRNTAAGTSGFGRRPTSKDYHH
jgi:hypothetical protein